MAVCGSFVGLLRAAAIATASEDELELIKGRPVDLKHAHDFLAFRHRARAAFRPICDCFSFDSRFARANPPRLPSVTAAGTFFFMAQNIPLCISVCNRLNDTFHNVLLQITSSIAHKAPFQLYKQRSATLGSPLSKRSLGHAENFRRLRRREQPSRGDRAWAGSIFPLQEFD
jgi:hypothetical protein